MINFIKKLTKIQKGISSSIEFIVFNRKKIINIFIFSSKNMRKSKINMFLDFRIIQPILNLQDIKLL